MDPTFPLELERKIFEISAISRPTVIPKLMRVAWRVKEWVEPLLYRTIALHSSQEIDGCPRFTDQRLLSAMHANPALFHDSVRNLYLYLPHSPTELRKMETILSHCTSLQNLSIMFKFTDPKCTKLIAAMPLRRLCGDYQPLLWDLPPTHHFFANITHLALGLVFNLTAADELCTRLALIPHLTHLSFDPLGIIPHCMRLLQDCLLLQVLVLFALDLGQYEWWQQDLAALSHDPRFLAMGPALYVEDWHMGVQEGLDYWARAEDFIAHRRTGKINPLQYEIYHVSVDYRDNIFGVEMNST
ncbi:hypothetical protein B0H16DRAFT_1737196 [Mycena metata]|uniref:Uncharacterized protein n=1 Tax=Mycena metata TaxID=1033252 RepID=A0AAD7MM62_9AGAR|nr:hypothetical protein B0H16DRAFT_1737196 [Mycena metata]